MKFKRLHVETH